MSSRLIELYNRTSKHSNYQVLSKRLRQLVPTDAFHTRSRYEQERLDFITNHVDLKNTIVVDVGGNTGFFSFEAIERGANIVHYFEGNKEHAEFVAESARQLGIEERIVVSNRYVDFEGAETVRKSDVLFLLNVLHHLGDDFGDPAISKHNALQQIRVAIDQLSESTKTLVFQLGFNWHGDTTKPLFANGTKQEMIDFVQTSAEASWNVAHIGVAERRVSHVTYQPLSPGNCQRDDLLGEFLNRPLFILERRCAL